MGKKLASIGGLLAALVIFVAINIVAGAGLSTARIDVTENHLYTLSQGSRNIARGLKDPVKLTMYYSEGQSAAIPAQTRSYAQRVKEVLREFEIASGGKLSLEFVNPEPFSDEEDKAVQAGLVGAPLQPGSPDRVYFGLVGTNSTDGQQVVPFFDPRREEFLEYELTRMIYVLSDPEKKTVGLMSWLPIQGAEPNPMLGQQGQTPPWQIVTQMKEFFDVRTIAADAAEIPADVKVLLIVHPKTVSDKTLYAIDQFILRGGRAVIMVDPNCSVDVPPGINPMQAMNLPKSSNLTKIFDAWGIEMVEGKFAADRDAGIPVNVGSEQRSEVVSYVALLALTAEGKNTDKQDPITGELRRFHIGTAGILQKKQAATVELTPLLFTGTNAMQMDVQRVQAFPDPKSLLADFAPGGTSLTVAGRVTGKVKSAFTGPPEAPAPAEGAPPPPTTAHIGESADPINVVVIADCDMLTDRFWINEERLGQMVLGYSKLADNGDLVIGALDNLTGSSDLISVRARGSFARPFDRVTQIQKEAEQAYLTKERDLQKRLRDTEAKIQELQRQRPDAEGNAAMLLSPEQQAEIEKFRAQLVDTRKELRDVQHQMRKDIERLGTRLRFLNVGLMPILVGAAAVGLAFWRVRRRGIDRLNRPALA